MGYSRHIRIVPEDYNVRLYYKGKLVQVGPLHEIRDRVDDEEQMRFLRAWSRLRRIRNNRRKRCREKACNKIRHFINA